MNDIKKLRTELNLTVRGLSKLSTLATGYISELENDSTGRTNPTKETMDKIAKALNTTVAKVFYNTSD